MEKISDISDVTVHLVWVVYRIPLHKFSLIIKDLGIFGNLHLDVDADIVITDEKIFFLLINHLSIKNWSTIFEIALNKLQPFESFDTNAHGPPRSETFAISLNENVSVPELFAIPYPFTARVERAVFFNINTNEYLYFLIKVERGQRRVIALEDIPENFSFVKLDDVGESWTNYVQLSENGLFCRYAFGMWFGKCQRFRALQTITRGSPIEIMTGKGTIYAYPDEHLHHQGC